MPRSNHGQMFARQHPGCTELKPAAYGLSLPSPGYATGVNACKPRCTWRRVAVCAEKQSVDEVR